MQSSMFPGNKPRFFSTHNSCVRSVAFNPRDRYVFCSGGNDGQIAIYHAGRAELTQIHSVISSGLNRYVSAVGFSSDGNKILATTSSRRVSVIDVEHGTPIVCYDNCAYSPSRDRTPIAFDPQCPNIAACSYVNGKGISILDLRMPLPLDFIFDFHTDTIRDITFLHESWPFSPKSSSSTSGQTLPAASSFSSSSSASSSSSSLLMDTGYETNSSSNQPTNNSNNNGSSHHNKACMGGSVGSGGGYTLLSLSSQGVAKVTTLDGRLLHTFDFGQPSNSISVTPENYAQPGQEPYGFTSAWICGGYNISSYVPNEETLKQNQTNSNTSGQQNSSSSNLASIYDQHYSSSALIPPTQIHYNPTYNLDLLNNRNNNNNPSGSASGPSGDQVAGESGSVGRFNVIISPNNANLNIYQIPRRNELIFGSGSSGSHSHHGSNHHHIDSIRIQRAIRSIVASSHLQAIHVGVPSGSSSSNALQSSSSSNNRLLRNIIRRQQAPPPPHQNQPNQDQLGMNVEAEEEDDDDDDDDEDDDDNDEVLNRPVGSSSTVNSGDSGLKISDVQMLNTGQEGMKKTLFYHDQWDHRYDNGISPGSADQHPQLQQIWRMRFTSSGAHLYAAGEGGFVRVYRRYPNSIIQGLGEVYRHRNDVLDMDISPYDEFLVTASKDKTVGLTCLGPPSHGWTEYFEYT